MVIDPIADMLTRIRNAGMALHESVELPASKFKEQLANLLVREGYLERAERSEIDGKPVLLLTLRRHRGRLAFTEIRRMSSPAGRHYVGVSDIPYIANGLGIAVISTSKGLMTDREARKAGLGGELICTIR